MNTRKIISVVGILLVLAAVGVGTSMTMMSQAKYHEHGGDQWNADLDASLQTAQEQSAPVALYLWSDDCGACERFDSNLESEGTPAAFDRYVLASVSVSDNPEVMNRYGVEATPTIVVLDPSGERVTAFNPLAVDDLQERLERASANTTSISTSSTDSDVQSNTDDT